MKMLINKANPAIRITAPEIEEDKTCYYVAELAIGKYNWTLVEEEENIDNMPIYFKIPITTRYSDDLSYFDMKFTHVVKTNKFCERDIYGDECCCYYVSSIYKAVKDKVWLFSELAECGYVPTIEDFIRGLFKEMKDENADKQSKSCNQDNRTRDRVL